MRSAGSGLSIGGSRASHRVPASSPCRSRTSRARASEQWYWVTPSNSSAPSPSRPTVTPSASRSSPSPVSSPSASAPTRSRSTASTGSGRRSPPRQPSSSGRHHEPRQIAEGVRAKARLLEDPRAEREAEAEGKPGRQGPSPSPPSQVHDPEARRDVAPLRPPARDRRRPRLLGGPQGPFPRPPRQAARDANRGPPARVPGVRRRDPEGRVRSGTDDRLGSRGLRE